MNLIFSVLFSSVQIGISNHFWIVLLIIFIAALFVSSIGFFRVVYFISIGYGFSVAAAAAIMIVAYLPAPEPFALIQAILLAGYGLRLSIFLIVRERQNSFKQANGDIENQYGSTGLIKKLVIWIGVSILYVAMITPALLALDYARTTGASAFIPVRIAGLGLMIAGLAFEAIADAQKSAFKKKNPAKPCTTGLYRIVRQPNYFGEIAIWTGSLVAGLPAFTLWFHWVISIFGYVCIVLVMLGSARRLELSQQKRYGKSKEYVQYTKNVPVLIPIVPLHSLKNLKVYLG